MKLLITGMMAYQFPCHKFAKPVSNFDQQLNPILGETFAGECDDGTDIYLE